MTAGTSLDASSIFLEGPAYSSGGSLAVSVAVGDLNGDGIPDVIVGNTNSTVGVLLGNGDGTLQAPITYNTGSPGGFSLQIADVNGDGHPDLIMVTACQSSGICNDSGISILLGNGDGTFQSPVLYDSGGQDSSWVVVADVNGDGHPDLVVANPCADVNCINGSIGVLLGKADGTFQPPIVFASNGAFPLSIAVGDLNGDGHPDLAIANECQTQDGSGNCAGPTYLTVMIGNGNGTFSSPVTYDSGGTDAFSVLIADVNRDGRPDLLVGNYCQADGTCDTGAIGVLMGNGNGTFQQPLILSTGAFFPVALAVGDVNGDGHVDLVAAHVTQSINQSSDQGEGIVSVLLGNGDGTFQIPATYSGGIFGTEAVAIGDLNGDGHSDLLVANACQDMNPSGSCPVGPPPGEVGVLLGRGDGTFRAPISYNTENFGANSVASADLNGDGHLDLVVANTCQTDLNCADGTLAVLLGKGDGTFGSPVNYDSGGVNSVSEAIGDLNGDGFPDLAVANYSDNTLGVLLGNGDGTFQTAVVYNAGALGPFSIAISDVNGDGHSDLIVANGCLDGSCNHGAVSVLLGNGDGTFQPASTIGLGSQYGLSIAVGDVNGDGRPDLVVGSFNGVSVLLGNGDGSFQSPTSYAVPGFAIAAAIGDINGDGPPDIVVANGCTTTNCDSGSVSILLGNGDGTFQSPSTISTIANFLGGLVLSDLNGDGNLDIVSGADFLMLGNGDGTFQSPLQLGADGPGIAVGDFNGDGKPDLAVGGVTVLLNIASPFRYRTTTTLASSANPASGPVTFTATVTPAFNAGTETGNVTFYDGANSIGTAPVSNGQAVLSNVTLSSGTHSITAVYGGDSTYLPSTSAVLHQVVNSSSPTTTTLTSSQNPSFYNQTVTFTATVSSSGGGTPTGNVTFLDGTSTLATIALTNGVATFSTSALSVGTHSITAAYAGDSSHTASSSSPVSQIVNPEPSAVALASSANPSVYLQPVTLTATITPQYGGTATGTVTFYDSGSPLGTTPVSGNAANLTVSFNVGTHTLTAVYSGDGNVNGNSSAPVSQTVTRAATATTIVSSQNPAKAGQPITFTITVAPQFAGTPTGTVAFYRGKALLATLTLASGQATYTTPLPPGTSQMRAVYQGDSNFNPSTSPVLNEVVLLPSH